MVVIVSKLHNEDVITKNLPQKNNMNLLESGLSLTFLNCFGNSQPVFLRLYSFNGRIFRVAQNTVTVLSRSHSDSPVTSCEVCVELQRITLWVSDPEQVL